MIIDLTHNKIVRSTISDRFKESVDEVLIPLLREKYGDALLGIQMYEDYLADNFAVGKEWYYPLTLVTDGGIKVEWISWSVKKGEFEGDVPYAYVGKDALAFSLADNVPAEFDARLEGRAHYFEGGTVKVRVETTATDVTVLSGRYSQTFVDEMARQLTGVLERTMEVSGIADSSIEVAIVFTPDTYLEHTSENVTYRRLLIVDKSSSPRDLWIKWTRTDGCGAYSASDSVTADSIVFELGENVSQKVREKEYRFLLRASKERYHKSMGRKNITEWRDVLKRAARRGDLEKTGGEDLLAKAEAKALAEAAEAAAAKETAAVEETAAAPEAVEMTEDEELALAMEMARRAMDSVNDDAEIVDDDADEEDEELDELDAFYAEDTAEVGTGIVTDDEDEQRELAEITRLAMEALKFAAEQDKEDEKEAPAFVSFGDEAEETIEIDGEIEEIIDDEELEDEETLEDAPALEPDEEPETVAEAPVAPTEEKTTVIVEKTVGTAELEAKIRGELEAKIRLEYETRARERAEEEAERLRREQEQLRLENERLQDRARREKAEWTRIEENRRAEAEKLRTQIEAQVRQEAKERERLAEAARAAVEEQHRLEAEKLRQEREKLEAERRADAERRRAEEEARIEAARRAEAERIRRSEEAEKPAEEPQYIDNNYTYVSKTVRLIFRRSVDPNITARIHEIIKATLEYYGKEKVYMRIKATVPDTSTVCLEFVKIPLEEMELLSNIIKVIGNSGLGIAKAILE